LKPALLAAGILGLLAGCALQPPSATAPLQTPPAASLASAPAPAPAAAVDPAALFVANATAMIGQPYRYGGAQPGGFDCSGLVAYASSRAGIYLPRTAQEQLRAGAPVRRNDLKAGDLVFMHLKGKDLHVGVALDAQRFVHAPATGGRVRIDSLERAPYSTGFSSARRVVDARAPP
jgi:cell wall-associated NlpC family hydrolase